MDQPSSAPRDRLAREFPIYLVGLGLVLLALGLYVLRCVDPSGPGFMGIHPPVAGVVLLASGGIKLGCGVLLIIAKNRKWAYIGIAVSGLLSVLCGLATLLPWLDEGRFPRDHAPMGIFPVIFCYFALRAIALARRC